MGNQYYDHTTYPAQGALASSSSLRAEFDAVETGFDKLPTLSGNASKVVVVNDSGTGMTVKNSSEMATYLGLGNAVLTTGSYGDPSWITSLSGTKLTGAVKPTKSTVTLVSTPVTAVSGGCYAFTASTTLTLPVTPAAGDVVWVSNRSGVNTAVIARNGSNIMGLAEDLTVNLLNAGFGLVFADATRGWVLL